MKPTELMTWAGPFPPDVIEAWCADEMDQLMTLAGPVSPDDQSSVRISASSGEAICWAGPLPPGDEEFPRRRARSVLASKPSGGARAEAKA